MKTKIREKKCKCCGVKFKPKSSLQTVCDYLCAIDYSRKQEQLKLKREVREQKEKLKGRTDHLKDAQKAFNDYVRFRDRNKPCISCQRHHQGQYHAGHYRTVKAHPELRFHPFNNNKQCSVCNNHLSGNIIEYRKNLIDKIGLENVEWIEAQHKPQKLTVQEILDIKNHYKEQLKYLRSLENG